LHPYDLLPVQAIIYPVLLFSCGTKATYKNGILEVRIPKEKTDTKKRINVDFD